MSNRQRKNIMNRAKHPVLGVISRHWASEIAQSKARQFISPYRVRGLAVFDEARLDLIAVIVDEQGRGYFRQFMLACKEHFEIIHVWAVMNPAMDEILAKYGFTGTIEKFQGEIQHGYIWRKS